MGYFSSGNLIISRDIALHNLNFCLLHTDWYVCNYCRMGKPSRPAEKSKQCWHVWTYRHCCENQGDKTRAKILMAAFDEIYHYGFQAASLNNILNNTDATKGALYHHFRNKMELGYAVVDEVICETIKNNWIEPLAKNDDPISILQQLLIHSGELMNEGTVRLGCPLNNLAQEMSPIDESFRKRIITLYEEWCTALEEAFERGKKAGTVNPEVDAEQIALLFIATLEGCMGFAKTNQSLETLISCGQGLIEQLESLRPL